MRDMFGWVSCVPLHCATEQEAQRRRELQRQADMAGEPGHANVMGQKYERYLDSRAIIDDKQEERDQREEENGGAAIWRAVQRDRLGRLTKGLMEPLPLPRVRHLARHQWPAAVTLCVVRRYSPSCHHRVWSLFRLWVSRLRSRRRSKTPRRSRSKPPSMQRVPRRRSRFLATRPHERRRSRRTTGRSSR